MPLSPRAFWRAAKSFVSSSSFDSQAYWEKRYARGKHSGAGSRGKLAEFKAAVLNEFVAKNQIGTIIEYGCGDGYQLSLANYPQYIGFDVSVTAVQSCRKLFANDATKSFKEMRDYGGEIAELTLSLDVIYYLIEDEVYEAYMDKVFSSANRFVIIYSSNCDSLNRVEPKHLKHRRFSVWIEDHAWEWKLIDHIPNKYPYTGNNDEGSFSDFYVYERCTRSAVIETTCESDE